MSKFLISLVILICLFVTPSHAEMEIIEPDGESNPTQWAYSGSATKPCATALDHVNGDNADTCYIEEYILNSDHGWTMSNPASVSGNIDSVVAVFRGKVASFYFDAEARLEQIVGSDTTYGTSFTFLAGWLNKRQTFASAPHGGVWTINDLNNLKANLTITSQSTQTKQIQVSYIYFEIYYTPDDLTFARRRHLMSRG